MDRRIRYLGLFLVACFGLLVAQLNNLQVASAPTLNAKSAYTAHTATLPSFELPRGEIVTADGVKIAFSVPTNDQYRELREYPEGSLYTDVTGYYDTTAYSAPYGLEAEYDSELQPHSATASNLRQLLTEQTGTDSVVTTIRSSVQIAAEKALAPYHAGAVVAIDPQNGAILALYGKPTFDANTLATHDAAAAGAAYHALDPNSGNSPLVDEATDQLFNPGSTFKVITTSAIYDHDPSLETMYWKPVSQISLKETTKTLQNFGGEVCGGTLSVVLARSCDTSYALIGLSLGAPNLAAEAASFGFNTQPPIDLPVSEVNAPCFPPVNGAASTNTIGCPSGVPSIGPQNTPDIAYSAIGQLNVTESALEEALVASAIADGGTMMTPHLMAKIVSNNGTIVKSYTPTVWREATTAGTADAVRALMRGVVDSPGGTAAEVGFPSADDVAAKTGTAETGTTGCSTDWLIATAPADPADTPTIAVAAVVPYQTGLTTCNGTGAEYAGPVVKSVLVAALAAQS